MIPVLSDQIANNLGRANPAARYDIGNSSYPNQSAAPASMRPPSPAENANAGRIATATFQGGRYGDAQLLTFIFPGAGDQLVLIRPTTGQRVLLIIENDFAAAVIRVNFDNQAALAVGIPIAAGGNLFFDTVVPQNDIHIFAPGAGAAQITYINLDVTNPLRVIQANQ